MKAVLIFFNVSIETEVLEVLEAQGIAYYSQWPRMIGEGPVTGARKDSHVWPGANSGIVAVVPEEKANPLMDALQTFRDSSVGKLAGVRAFMLPVERALV